MRKILLLILVISQFVFGGSNVDLLVKKLNKASGAERIDILIEIGNIYWVDYYDQALPYFQKAIKEAGELDEKIHLANASFYLGRMFYFKSMLDSSEYYLKQANTIYTAYNDSSGIGKCLSHLGLLHWLLNDQTIAEEYLKQALEIQRALDDKQEVGKILTNIGNFHRQQSDYHGALTYYLEALENYRSINYAEGIAWLYFSSALLYKDMKDYKKAIEYIYLSEKSYGEIAAATGDSGGVTICYSQLGDMYRLIGENTKALEYLAKALRLQKKLGVSSSIADGLIRTAQVYYEMGDYPKALDYALKAYEIRKTSKDISGKATNLKYIGYIYHALGDSQKALEYLDLALEFARVREDHNNEGDILKYTANIYYELQKTDSAYKYINMYSAVKDSIFNDKISSRVASLQVQYELKEQELKTQRLEQEFRINEMELARQHIVRNYLILLSLAGLIIIVVIALLYRNKVKDNREIRQARDELSQEIEERKAIEKEREKLIKQQQEALEKIKTLSGLIPICSHCKKIRNDNGYYEQLEKYIMDHSDAVFSHGICPECMERYYSDFVDKKKNR